MSNTINMALSMIVAITLGCGASASIAADQDLIFKKRLEGLQTADSSGVTEDKEESESGSTEEGAAEDDAIEEGEYVCQIPVGLELVQVYKYYFYQQTSFYLPNGSVEQYGIGSQKLCDIDLYASTSLDTDGYGYVMISDYPISPDYPGSTGDYLAENVTIKKVTYIDESGNDLFSRSGSDLHNTYDYGYKEVNAEFLIDDQDISNIVSQASVLEISYEIEYPEEEVVDQGDADSNCYDPQNVGKVGEEGWTGCEGLWIVDNELIYLSADLVANYGYDEGEFGEGEFVFEDEPVFGYEPVFEDGDSSEDYNGEIYPPDQIFTGQVTTMENLFNAFQCVDMAGCPLTYEVPDISYWDVSNVVNFRGMFSGAVVNASLDGWDTSKAEDMSEMFKHAYVEKPNDLSGWDVSNVKDMSEMFFSAELGYFTIGSEWDVSNVESFSGMFRSATRSDYSIGFADFSNWDTSNVKYMDRMFKNAYDFLNPSIVHWDVSSVIDMSDMLSGNYLANFDGISQWDVSSVIDMSRLFYATTGLDAKIGQWNVSNVVNMESMFDWARGFNQDISGWDVSSVKNMSGMFMDTDVFNQPLNSWNVENVKDFSYMFNRTEAFNQPLGNWKVTSAEDMSSMFREVNAFNQDLSGWCVDHIKFEPYRFSLNAYSWVMPDARPVWGTCPTSH